MNPRDAALAAIALYTIWMFVLFLCLMAGVYAYLRRRMR